MPIVETVELEGATKVQHDFDEVMKRMLNARTGLRRTIPILEQSEAEIFAELGGRYVKTGATMRSLTMSKDANAVRKPSAKALKFGTKVWYAKFLVEKPGPPAEKGGLERHPPSAIAKIPEHVGEECARVVQRYIVGGVADAYGLGGDEL